MALFRKDRDLSQTTAEVELEVRASDFRAKVDGFALRLDAFLLHHLSWRSRSSIQVLIRDGSVRVDPWTPDSGTSGEACVETRASKKLMHGSRVVVEIPEELRLPTITHDPDSLAVLFEDDEAVAVDKPPLMPVHPAGRHLAGTLIQRLHARYRAELEQDKRTRQRVGDARLPLRLCHRLDRETSGIVLAGKGDRAHRELMGQFERREVEKEYLAIVHGAPDADAGTIDAPLGQARESEVRLKMACVDGGLPSRTDFRVLERLERVTLVACRLHTGRQHQIRVHMEWIGCPLVGDKLYGIDENVFLRGAKDDLLPEDEARLLLPRHALHNHRLAFTSPSTGERREVVSPLAADLETFLDRVRAGATLSG